ncbi:ABC1 kinase family protein [Mycolicibacterium sp. Dal123E01]|uniref:ABC1 kinase family protein n=1 Tax=Mycolicibacterium sp. Dal123E01 TaxID=3457578 RepID=UPI00403E4F5F
MPNFDITRGRLKRTMPLAGFTARAAGGRMVAGLREKAGNDGAVEQFHERTAERYAELLGHSKGVLMKLGQAMSLVDTSAMGSGGFAPYQKAMTRLQADVPPMTPALAREVFEAELGSAVQQFADFDDVAMAAASIGQVHRAVLHDGRDVVVKIQYPGVAQAIRDDLANTELAATFLRFAMSASGIKVDVRSTAREWSERISEELDYRREAANIAAFGALYRGHPFIRIPQVIPEGSTGRVLTMTYLDGMDWAAAQQADQNLKNTWAEVIMRFSLGNHRHASLIHADPHPGNYRFHPDGTVGFVDFGCVIVISEHTRWHFVAMSRAAMDDRIDEFRHHMVQLGFLTQDSDITAEELYEWFAPMLYEVLADKQPATYSPDTTARTLSGLLDIRDSDHLLARMTVPKEQAFGSRVQLAIGHICAGLNATLPARASADDMDGVAEPITELGKLHHAWVRERGLPGALDHHDHP